MPRIPFFQGRLRCCRTGSGPRTGRGLPTFPRSLGFTAVLALPPWGQEGPRLPPNTSPISWGETTRAEHRRKRLA